MIKNTNVESFEKIYFAYLRKHPQFSRKVNSLYFKTEEIQILYSLFKKYYEQYSEVPSPKQLWEIIKASKSANNISKEAFRSILKVKLDEYDNAWVENNFDAWLGTRTLDDSISETIEYLRGVELNEENYKEVIQNVRNIVNDKNSLNFRFDKGLDFFDPDAHFQDDAHSGVTTGYQNLDRILGGGFATKTLNAIMGESNIGKSIFLANFAVNAVMNGYNTVFITAEMADKRVLKRLGSNLLNIKMENYDKFSKDPAKVKKALNNIGQGLNLNEKGKLFIKEYPTSEATVADIDGYIRELEEAQNIKIRYVIVDYINILSDQRGANGTENTYIKIKNIAEDLRAMMVKGDKIGVTVTQVNGSGLQSSDLTQSNIAESKALIHTCDTLFGIIQTPEMHRDCRYYLKSIKLRDSGGKFKRIGFDIDYDYMRLKENNEITELTE